MPLKVRSKWIEFIQSRWMIRLLALCIAFAAWVYVNAGEETIEAKDVRIVFQSMPAGFVFQRPPLQKAKIELKGSLYQMRRLKEDDLTFRVDLSGARSGALRIEIEPQLLSIPEGMQVLQISPRLFSVYLEEIFSKQVTLEPELVGKVAPGYELRRVRIVPPLITVSGPRLWVNSVDKIRVPVRLDNKQSSFTAPEVIVLPHADLVSIESVMVEAEIGLEARVRDVPNISVLPYPSSANVRVQPPNATLSIEWLQPPSDLLLSQIRVFVSVEGLKPGRYRLRGTIEAPDGLRVTKLEPPSFLVDVLEPPK